jgi:hypothetical protein
MNARRFLLLQLTALGLPAALQAAPSLVKLVDFNNSNIVSPSPARVNDSAILIGSKLWFACEQGGAYGFGSLSSYDINAGILAVELSLDNETGLTPKASPVRDGNLLYLTTIGNNRDGSSIYSTLFSYNIATGITDYKLWEASGSSGIHIRAPWGGVAIIDRGSTGKDLYFNNYSGGTSNSSGAILRYETATGTTHLVYSMPASPGNGPRQPYKGLTIVGTDLYFTTFSGGSGPAGGTLCKLDASIRGAETVEVLASMPETHAQLPSHNPYYRALDHSLYFTTVGSNTQPGALMKFDLNTKKLSVIHRIAGATNIGGTNYYLEGNKCYGPVVEWDKALYYTTIAGGAYATNTTIGGTINRYDLRTAQHETLFSLDANTTVNPAIPTDNSGGEIRGGGVFNGSTTAPAFYYITKTGGNFGFTATTGYGTILKLNLDPAGPPSTYETWSADYPSLTPAQIAPTADPDRDGRNNLSEFCFGTSPTSGSDGNGYSAIHTSAGLELRWTARADESIQYVTETSINLSTWSPLAISSEVIIPEVALPTGYERRRVIIPTTNSKQFFRIEATLLPQAQP